MDDRLLPSRADEKSLLATLQFRVEDTLRLHPEDWGRFLGQQATLATNDLRLEWREEALSNADREDLRARVGLGHHAMLHLPAGQNIEGRALTRGLFRPRCLARFALGSAADWNLLADGGDGSLTLAYASEWLRTLKAREPRGLPFYAVLAGSFSPKPTTSPEPGLALLAWEHETRSWNFVGRPAEPELELLFFPHSRGECLHTINRWLEARGAFPVLAYDVAKALSVPIQTILQSLGKEQSRYALYQHGGQFLVRPRTSSQNPL